MTKKANISAGEIRQWCYCPRQWYLLRTGGRRLMTPASRQGVAYHQKEAVKVKAVVRSQSALVTILILGGAACCIWLLFWQ